MSRTTVLTRQNDASAAFDKRPDASVPLTNSDEETSSRSPRPLRLEVIDNLAALQKLDDAWNRLSDKAGAGHRVFQSHGWCNAWWKGFCGAGASCHKVQLRIIAGWDDDELVMVWPLAVQHSKLLNVLTWAGSPLSQYGDILIQPGPRQDAWIAQAWFLISNWPDIDYINLRKVRNDSPVRGILSRQAVPLGVVEMAPLVELESFEDWTAYRARMRGKSRKQQDRFSRNLKKQGDVNFSVVTGESAIPFIDEAITMKRDWLQRTGRMSDAISDTGTAETLKAVADAAHASAQILVARLCLDEKPIAVEVGLASNGYYCSFLGTYDHGSGHLRPGNVEIEKMIQWTLENKFSTFDLLAPDDTYKQRWATGHVTIRDFGDSNSLVGHLYLHGYLRWMRPNLKRAYYALPENWRRLILRLTDSGTNEQG